LNVHPQSSVRWISNVDWGDVVQLDDEWLVFVSLSVSGDPEAAPPQDAFSLIAGDTSFVARERLGEARLFLVLPDSTVRGRPYDPTDRPERWLAFTVPAEFDSAPELALQAEHGPVVASYRSEGPHRWPATDLRGHRVRRT
jgi:hypothetical protein